MSAVDEPARRRRKALTPFARILFVSTRNAARSPIAETILTWLAVGQAAAASAGVAPAREIHPLARAAVRNVFNSRIAQERPRDVRAYADERFDYVITLSQEASEQCPPFPKRPQLIHWAVENPDLARGTRDERQRAFDRVTRDLLKRLRAWWPPSTHAGASSPRRRARRRQAERARWRTRPNLEAPLLAVAYFGPMRRCTNMCALLERSGFRVFCGERFGRTPTALAVVPDAIVVRTDGGACVEVPRPEVRAVEALRQAFEQTPMVLLGNRTPSADERRILDACHAGFLRRRPQNRPGLVDALKELVRSR